MYIHYPQLTDEETEIQRGHENHLSSYCWNVRDVDLNLGSLIPGKESDPRK